MGIVDWIKGEKVLYYPGCLTKGVLKEQFENYKEIFNRLGVDFVLMSNTEVCCGLPVLNAGYKKDTRKLAKKNLKLFKEKGITKIITSCPSCFHTFKDVYPKLERDWDIELEHATVTILKALKRKGIRLSKKEKEFVGYHDPCHLGRYGGIYDEPREVIERLGGIIVEPKLTKEMALCCGAGGGVSVNFTKLAKDSAKERVKNFPEEISKIISPCGLCYINIKSASDKSIEFSTFVLNKLKESGI